MIQTTGHPLGVGWLCDIDHWSSSLAFWGAVRGGGALLWIEYRVRVHIFVVWIEYLVCVNIFVFC